MKKVGKRIEFIKKKDEKAEEENNSLTMKLNSISYVLKSGVVNSVSNFAYAFYLFKLLLRGFTSQDVGGGEEGILLTGWSFLPTIFFFNN